MENQPHFAVALNASGKIQQDHFGQAESYALFTSDGDYLKTRKNPYFGRHLHAKAEEILAVLKECPVWVGQTMGKRSREILMNQGIKTHLVVFDDPRKAVEAVRLMEMEEE